MGCVIPTSATGVTSLFNESTLKQERTRSQKLANFNL